MARRTFSAQQLQLFQHVNVSGMQNDQQYTVPDFLMIGPQRTGTTWLSRYLVQHPDVFIPAEKELYYFNYLMEQGALFHSTKLTWYLRKFEPSMRDFLRLNGMNLKMMGRLPKTSLDWFQYKKARVFGEATASYAAMDEGLIAEVLTLNPHIKIMMMVRNPIERAWSHAKKDLLKARKRSLKDVPFSEFSAFYQRDYQKRCGQYQSMIALWEKYVDKDCFLIQKFSDVKENPTKLFDRVCEFLEVTPMADSLMQHKQVVNPTQRTKLPQAHQALLESLFADEISYLQQQGWL